MITQRNMMSVMLSYRQLFAMSRMIFDHVTILNIAPWFHALGFMSLYMVSCAREVEFVFLPKFEEETFLKAIEKNKVNVLTVVPPIMVLLAKSPLVDKYDLSSIQDIGCGAAALSKETEDQVRQRLGEHIMIRQGYGLSEVTLGVLGSGVVRILNNFYVPIIFRISISDTQTRVSW
jgi:4-coumarate--CoA ligase